jgi:hypothetical protein
LRDALCRRTDSVLCNMNMFSHGKCSVVIAFEKKQPKRSQERKKTSFSAPSVWNRRWRRQTGTPNTQAFRKGSHAFKPVTITVPSCQSIRRLRCFGLQCVLVTCQNGIPGIRHHRTRTVRSQAIALPATHQI